MNVYRASYLAFLWCAVNGHLHQRRCAVVFNRRFFSSSWSYYRFRVSLDTHTLLSDVTETTEVRSFCTFDSLGAA